MAEVVRGRTLDGPWAGTEVAIKRLSPQLAKAPEYVELFAKEAELCIALRHPNIVQTVDAGTIGNVAYMAMEWVDGRDLGQVLRRCRKQGIWLPIDFAVYITRVLLEALDYAHRAESASGTPLHLVHCDVSPSNVFISRVGEVKLGDFGVARVRVKSGVRDAVVAGKPYYLSPEATAGEVTHGVDLWATAVVLFELLALERPFQGTDPTEVFSAIRSGKRAKVREKRRPRSARGWSRCWIARWPRTPGSASPRPETSPPRSSRTTTSGSARRWPSPRWSGGCSARPARSAARVGREPASLGQGRGICSVKAAAVQSDERIGVSRSRPRLRWSRPRQPPPMP